MQGVKTSAIKDLALDQARKNAEYLLPLLQMTLTLPDGVCSTLRHKRSDSAQDLWEGVGIGAKMVKAS